MSHFVGEDRSIKNYNVAVLKSDSPDVFWVTLRSGVKESEDSFSQFENELNNYMNFHQIKDSQRLPNKGDKVLAYNEKHHRWVRGEVICIVETAKGTQLQIFELDYGRKILISKYQFYSLQAPSDFLNRPFNAIKLVLPGLRPIRLGYVVNEDLQVDRRPGDAWDEGSQSFVEDCLKNYTSGRVSILKAISSYEIHGALFLTIDSIEINVAQELIKRQYALSCEEEFSGHCVPISESRLSDSSSPKRHSPIVTPQKFHLSEEFLAHNSRGIRNSNLLVGKLPHSAGQDPTIQMKRSEINVSGRATELMPRRKSDFSQPCLSNSKRSVDYNCSSADFFDIEESQSSKSVKVYPQILSSDLADKPMQTKHPCYRSQGRGSILLQQNQNSQYKSLHFDVNESKKLTCHDSITNSFNSLPLDSTKQLKGDHSRKNNLNSVILTDVPKGRGVLLLNKLKSLSPGNKSCSEEIGNANDRKAQNQNKIDDSCGNSYTDKKHICWKIGKDTEDLFVPSTSKPPEFSKRNWNVSNSSSLVSLRKQTKRSSIPELDIQSKKAASIQKESSQPGPQDIGCEESFRSYQESHDVLEAFQTNKFFPTQRRSFSREKDVREVFDKSGNIGTREENNFFNSHSPTSQELSGQIQHPVSNFSDAEDNCHCCPNQTFFTSKSKRKVNFQNPANTNKLQFLHGQCNRKTNSKLVTNEADLLEFKLLSIKNMDSKHSQSKPHKMHLHSHSQDSGYNCSCSSDESKLLELSNCDTVGNEEKLTQNKKEKKKKEIQICNMPCYLQLENRKSNAVAAYKNSSTIRAASTSPTFSIPPETIDKNLLSTDSSGVNGSSDYDERKKSKNHMDNIKSKSFAVSEQALSSYKENIESLEDNTVGVIFSNKQTSTTNKEVHQSVTSLCSPDTKLEHRHNNSSNVKSVDRKNSSKFHSSMPQSGENIKENINSKRTSVNKPKTSVSKTKDETADIPIKVQSEMNFIKNNNGINTEGDYLEKCTDSAENLHCEQQETRFIDEKLSQLLPLKLSAKVMDLITDDSPELVGNLALCSVLVSGSSPPKPVLDLNSANLDSTLRQQLVSQNFLGPCKIQSHVWPAIIRGRHATIIGSPKCGKTLSYLIPILSSVMTPTFYNTSQSGCGPFALILCSSEDTMEKISKYCFCYATFLKVHCLKDINIAKEKTKEILSINGSSILISTPSCFLHIMKLYNKQITNLDQLHHLILDEADILVEDFKDQLLEILREYTEVIQGKRGISQIIVCAEHWTDGIHSFMRKCMHEPLLYISSFSEAAVLTKVRFLPHICHSTKKDSKLLDLLSQSISVPLKTVICTAEEYAAKHLQFLLKCKQIPVLLISSKMTTFDMKDIIEEWNLQQSSGIHPLLIVVDDCFIDLQLTNADTLIHYDIPKISRAQFNSRLVCILNAMQMTANSIMENIMQNKYDKIAVNEKVSVQLLITEDDSSQASALIKHLRRFQCEIPEDLRKLAAGYSDTAVEIKGPASHPLCFNLKAFGNCNEKFCIGRHNISNNADEPTIPVESKVSILVLHVFDAAYYSARLLKYTTPDGTIHELNQYGTIAFGLLSHFNKSQNRIPCLDPEVNTICAYEKDKATYFRVQVVQYKKHCASKYKEENPKSRKQVYLIDCGWNEFVEANSLLKLPDVFLKIPPQAVEVHLCNIRPKNLEKDWSSTAKTEINKLIQNKELIGKVQLCLGRTLWLSPLTKYVWLNSVKAFNEECELSHKLLSEDFAELNNDHLTNLYKICPKNFLPKDACVENETVSNPKISSLFEKDGRYAFLEIQIYVKVFVSVIISPSQFYVQQCSFSKCLNELTNDINNCNQLKQLETFEEEMLCLARFPEDNKLYRAKIIKIEDESVEVFFLDYGEKEIIPKVDIYHIEQSHLTRLPFQAVSCSLAGVKPNTEDSWSPDAQQFFIEFVRDEDDVNEEVLLWVPSDNSSTGSVQRNYEVLLYKSSLNVDDVPVDIGLIKNNFAQMTEIEGRRPPWFEDFEEISEDEVNALAVPLSANAITSVQGCKEDENNQSNEIPEDEIEEMASRPVACNSEIVTEDGNGSQAEILSEDEISPKPVLCNTAVNHKDSAADRNGSQANVSQDQIISKSCGKANTFDDLQTPSEITAVCRNDSVAATVQWHQTETEVVLKILLADIGEYNYNLRPRHLHFSTLQGSKYFSNDLDLFGAVDCSNSSITNNGHNIVIHLQKAAKGLWRRLLMTNHKNLWLHYNYDHIQLSEGSESDKEIDFRPFQRKVKKKNKGKPPCAVKHYSSFEDDNSSSDKDSEEENPFSIS